MTRLFNLTNITLVNLLINKLHEYSQLKYHLDRIKKIDKFKMMFSVKLNTSVSNSIKKKRRYSNNYMSLGKLKDKRKLNLRTNIYNWYN